eukprot:jgi/Bigna1/145200/aug1.96_g19908
MSKKRPLQGCPTRTHGVQSKKPHTERSERLSGIKGEENGHRDHNDEASSSAANSKFEQAARERPSREMEGSEKKHSYQMKLGPFGSQSQQSSADIADHNSRTKGIESTDLREEDKEEGCTSTIDNGWE